MRIKTGLASITMRTTKRLVEKASKAFERFSLEFLRGDPTRMDDRRKIDRQNRINEKKMKEEVEVIRFVDENLENELRELAKINSRSIEITILRD